MHRYEAHAGVLCTSSRIMISAGMYMYVYI